MAKTYKSQFLAILRENESQMELLFNNISSFAIRQIMRVAQPDGSVPMFALYNLQQNIADVVTPAFLGQIGRGNRAPFQVLPNGTILPLSPYMRILWDSIQKAQRLAVERHARIMENRLNGAQDVMAVLRSANGNPFNGHVSEQVGIIGNPLVKYDPAHLWVDKRGYRLSDRIWRTSGMTRRKIDTFLEQGISSGKSALELSRELEVFLQPGRTLRTKAPYGTDASYDAMRLARTEITRAHAQANEMSALMNPFVEGIGVRLSASHPKTDICDEAAAASPFPKDAIPEQYKIPMHPHCLCTYYYEMNSSTNDVVEDLRQDARGERRQTGLIGPMLTELFLLLLNGVTGGQLQRSPIPGFQSANIRLPV